MAIESLHALEKASENKDIFEVVLDSDCTDRGVSREASLEKMHAPCGTEYAPQCCATFG